MAENIIIDVKTSGTNDLNRLNQILKDANANASNLKATLESLRSTMVSTKSSMIGLTTGTVEYTKALQNATIAAENFKRANAQIAQSVSSTSNINIGTNLTASFSAVEAVIIALGQEVNGVTQGLVAMNNAAQTNMVTNSISATQAGFNAMRGNIQGVTSAVVNMNATIGQTASNIQAVTTATAQNNQATINYSSTTLKLIAELGFSYEKVEQELIRMATTTGSNRAMVMELSNALQKLDTVTGLKDIVNQARQLRDSLSASHPGDLLTIQTLNAGLAESKSAMSALTTTMVTSTGSINVLKSNIAGLRAEFDSLTITERAADIATYNLGQTQAATQQQIAASQATLTGRIAATNAQLNAAKAAAGRASSSYNGLAMAIAQIGREVPNFFYSVQIGFMALSNNLPILVDEIKRAQAAGQSMGKAFNAALGGWNGAMLLMIILSTQFMKIAEAITKAINKIPTSLKLQIEIDTDALKKTEELRVKIMKFQADYNKAQSEGNRTQLKYLSEYASKEFGIHKDKLRRIMEDEKAQKQYFDSYLKMAEDTYYNEAIIKKKAEAQIAIESSGKEIKNLLEARFGAGTVEMKRAEAYLKKTATGGIGNWFEEVTNVFGTNQKIVDLFKLIIQSQKNLQNLPALRENVNYFNKPSNTPKTNVDSVSTSTTKFTTKFTTETIPNVATFEAEQANQLPTITQKFDEYFNEKNAIIEISQKNLGGIYTDWQGLVIDNNILLEEARRQDIKDTEAFYKEKLKLAFKDITEIYPEKVKAFDANESLYKNEIDNLNELYKQEANLKDNAAKAEDYKNDKLEKAKTAAAKKAINDEWVIWKEASDRNIKLNEQDIKASKDKIKKYKESRVEIQKELSELAKSPDEIQQLQEKLAELDTQFAQSLKNSATLTAESIKNKLETAGKLLDSLSGLSSGIASYYQANQTQSDSYYDAEEERINRMNVTDEQRTKLLDENEKARYEAKKESFNKQKKWEEASAWISFASGIVSIWSKSFGELGPIAGPIVAGIESAGLLATTLANVKTIKAQRLDAPNANSSSSGSSSSSSSLSSFVALNPSQTSMTTREEYLNNNNNKNTTDTVVKVTDINKVQNTVKVREYNSTY